jgi:hypothetical protein
VLLRFMERKLHIKRTRGTQEEVRFQYSCYFLRDSASAIGLRGRKPVFADAKIRLCKLIYPNLVNSTGTAHSSVSHECNNTNCTSQKCTVFASRHILYYITVMNISL